MKTTDSEIQLYIHIPFCKRKCAYCDFLSAPATFSQMESYMDALRKEISLRKGEAAGKRLRSVYIGGGTPSYLLSEQIERTMDLVQQEYPVQPDTEVTIEVNPGMVNEAKAKAYARCGINRISMGLQETHDELLAHLGRIHTYHKFLESYTLCRKAGFDNINIDLMCGIPGQSLEMWEETLTRVLRLRTPHLSCYGLIIEEGTPFYELYGEDEERRERGEEPLHLPSEELERSMYAMTGQMLREAGYHHYEISNYAKEGFESVHNNGYWQRYPYIGCGLGASSLVGEERWDNPREMEDYITPLSEGHLPDVEKSALSVKEQMEEFMFLGLRRMEGVYISDFTENFGRDSEVIYGDVMARLWEEGLLEKKEGRIFLTGKGIDVSNYVFSEFLIDSV